MRFGGGAPKQLLVDRRPVDARAERAAFLTPPGGRTRSSWRCRPRLAADPPAYLRAAPKPLRVVAGGARRQDSVANAFAGRRATRPIVVVIHDAARPFASADLIARTIAAAAETGAALAAVPARDTVKRSASG